MKSAKEYWTSKFDEYPQTDADRLAVVMMAEYYNYCKDNLTTNVPDEAETPAFLVGAVITSRNF